MKILFVCSSNICRSPYAELMFKKIVGENEVLKKNIESVKSTAVFNKSKKIFRKTANALLEDGVSQSEIDAFTPDFKWCNPEKLREADIIIGMSEFNRLCTPCKYWKKYKNLSVAAIGKNVGIPDPAFSTSDGYYRDTMDIIKTFLNVYAEKLIEEFQKNQTSDNA